MLESSASYLGGIVSTTISGANMAGSESGFLVLGRFAADALTEPLLMMFKTPFADQRLTLEARSAGDAVLVPDKTLLMRPPATLLLTRDSQSVVEGKNVAEQLDHG